MADEPMAGAGGELGALDVFQLLVRGGYPQTAHEFWNEYFCQMMIGEMLGMSPKLQSATSERDKLNEQVDQLAEMSRWVRAAPDKWPDEDWIVGAGGETWQWIVFISLGKYREFLSVKERERAAEYREMLMRAWDDPEGKILAEAIEEQRRKCKPAGRSWEFTFGTQLRAEELYGWLATLK